MKISRYTLTWPVRLRGIDKWDRTVNYICFAPPLEYRETLADIIFLPNNRQIYRTDGNLPPRGTPTTFSITTVLKVMAPGLAITICLLLLLSPQTLLGAEPNSLSGISGGKVYFKVAQEPAEVTLQFRSRYGWDEPISLHGPDGRLIQRERFGHKKSGKRSYQLDKGPGTYMLLLKPSYSYGISTSATGMVFQPDSQGPALYQKYGHQQFFFKVPGSTKKFELDYTHVFNFKARRSRLILFDHTGASKVKRNQPAIGRDSLMKALTGSSFKELSEGQKGSDVTLDSPPKALLPAKISIDSPEPGFWSVKAGGVSKHDGRTGLTLKGVPNFLAGAPQYWFDPSISTPAVHVSAQLEPIHGPKPILGLVGHMGQPGSHEEALLKKFGQQADKLYIRPQYVIPQSQGPTLRYAERYDPAHDSFSLVIMRALELAKNPKEICSNSAEAILGTIGRSPDSFTIQVFNEPNLAFSFSKYLDRYLDCVQAVKNNPATSGVQFAGPGLGSGEELDVIDYQWLEDFIKKADSHVDMISWNLYRVQDVLDTFLYTEAVERVDSIIQQADSDGDMEPIIIGATNRRGGLTDDSLFKGGEAALWWASTLSQVINTGKVKAIYYYSTIDQKGWGRKKGLFDGQLQPKPQAHVQRLFADLLQNDQLFALRSDHISLEGVAAQMGEKGQMILLNKGWHSLQVSLPDERTWHAQQLMTDGQLEKLPKSKTLEIKPGQILLLTSS